MAAAWDDEPEDSGGLLSVLNVGAGDIEIRFDRASDADVAKAKRIISDMLVRGYTLLVKDGDTLAKATGFDPEKELYFVRDAEGTTDAPAPPGMESTEATDAASNIPGEVTPPKRRGRPKGSRKGIPMRTAQATGIGPTAGG